MRFWTRWLSTLAGCVALSACSSVGYGNDARDLKAEDFSLKQAGFNAAKARPGETIEFSAEIEAAADAGDLIVHLQLFDGDNISVLKQPATGQWFSEGETRSYDLSWTIPALQSGGEYAASVGIFDAGWQMIAWFDRIETVRIDGAAASGTALPAADLTPGQNLLDHLPDHFGLGVKADQRGDLEWMAETGAPFDYRYGYLAGGVNTGRSWAEWSSPRGDYATRFMLSSDENGYLPILSYYQIVQSAPNANQEPPYNNLIDASTMYAYFEDWVLLLDRAAAFGKPVILHHEPDLWGFLQRKADDPTGAPVAVGSSGYPDVAGMEDNARGLAQALVKLRNERAPNAILAWHATHWATGPDLTVNNADGTEMGKKVAAYFEKLEAPFEMIFVGPSDRDAAWRQQRKGQDAWWDEADHGRFYDFIKAVLGDTGKPGMIWQIPLGNTIYRTVNNTPGHFQDNHVEYFMLPDNRQNIVDHAEIGIVGLLFGGGFREQSSFRDVVQDGITNPEPINGNTAVAEHPDDDGGLLRLTSKAFYEQPPIGLR